MTTVSRGGTAPAGVAGRGALLVGFVAAVIACIVVVRPDATLMFVAYGGAGVYLAVRRPSNSIGWLLIAVASGLAIGSVRVTAGAAALESGDLNAVEAVSAWAYGWGWSLVFIGFVGLTIVYPSGRLPAGRGRLAGRAAIAVSVTLAVMMAIGPSLIVLPAGAVEEIPVPNPLSRGMPAPLTAWFPSPGMLFPLMAIVALMGLLGMFVRFGRSRGLERLQYRWLVAAVMVVALGTLIWVVATQILGLPTQGPVRLVILVTYPAIPIAIAIAVLRYRLYQLDRIVSRTISYALVTGVLGAVFATAVISLEAVLATVTQGQTLAVAVSTLVAAALFQPLRGRVQSAVDRRFDRERHDAGLTAVSFAERLRSEVDLPTVAAELNATVHSVMAPTGMGLWLRRPRA